MISKGGQEDVIPGKADRQGSARISLGGAARADFLLEGGPRNFGGIAGQESGFAYWGRRGKAKNLPSMLRKSGNSVGDVEWAKTSDIDDAAAQQVIAR